MSPERENRRFFLLRARSDWQRGDFRGAAWQRGLTVAGGLDYTRRQRFPLGIPAGIPGRWEGAGGCCHTLYFMDLETARLYGFDLARKRLDRVWNLDGLFQNPRAAVLAENRLIVLDGAETMVAIHHYDLRRGAFEDILICGTGADDVGPGQLARDDCGTIYLPGEKTTVLQVKPDGSERVFRHPHLDGYRILALACGPDRRLHVLYGNEAKEKWLCFKDNGESQGMGLDFSLALPGARPVGLAVDTKGRIYVADAAMGRARFFGETPIYQWKPGMAKPREVGRAKGRIDRLFMDGEQRLVVLNSAAAEITVFHFETHYGRAEYFSRGFDSGHDRTRWHRYELDFDLPAGTEIRVAYAVTDQDPENTPITSWSPPALNPTSALIRAQPGRYLQFRIQLRGRHGARPLVKGLHVSFPRTSYQRYLPAIYHTRHDQFGERYLALFESFFQQTKARIDRIPALFDVDAASGPALHWLATWLGIPYYEQVDDLELRALMKFAPLWYRTRGTRHGMLLLVRAFLAFSARVLGPHQARGDTLPEPVLVERVDLLGIEGGNRAQLDRSYGKDRHSFVILLDPHHLRTDQGLEILNDYVQAGKPAHTRARLVVLRKAIIPGNHVYLGINTFVQPEPRLGIDAGLH